MTDLASELVNGKQVDLPLQLRFPDESEVLIKTWQQILTETVRWLVDHGHLQTASCPIALSNATKRYLVDTKPIHPSGKIFEPHVQVGSFHKFQRMERTSRLSETPKRLSVTLEYCLLSLARLRNETSNCARFWLGSLTCRARA